MPVQVQFSCNTLIAMLHMHLTRYVNFKFADPFAFGSLLAGVGLWAMELVAFLVQCATNSEWRLVRILMGKNHHLEMVIRYGRVDEIFLKK